MGHNHFHGKDALAHVAEKQAQGMLTSKEVHGLEVPGYLQAGLDSARDVAIALMLFFSLLIHFDLNLMTFARMVGLFGLGLILWKAGRATWLAWGRLERLHRILTQEKWEIEHNRPQEREELHALYSAKGFEGKLLEDVVDVLMADETRLLKVMIEEEMGLTLENMEHPLKHGFGALLGSLVATLLCLLGLMISWNWGLVAAALAIVGGSSWIAAHKADNRALPAVIWALGVAVLAWSVSYFFAVYL